MKTKLLKLGTPLMVFSLAIVFAYATSPEPVAEDLALVPGYIMQNGKCESVRTCSTIPGPKCEVNGRILGAKINETQCGSELFHWNNG